METSTNDELEHQWIQQAREGCETSFRQLFDLYYGLVFSVLVRGCGNSHDAEDLTQEVFVKAARKLESYREEASFRNWLCRIALNTSRDWYRRNQRRPQATATLEEMEWGDRMASEPKNPVREQLQEALSRLNETERHALVLVYYEGFKHAEVADILSCAESTVSWYVHQARSKLKQWLLASSHV